MKKTIILSMTLAALLLTACSGQKVKKDVVTKKEGNSTSRDTIGSGSASGTITSETRGDSSNFNYLPDSNNPNDTRDISLAGLNDPENLLSQRIIYFDYNQAAIRPEYMVLIETHAKLLAKYPNLNMRLEGHADERGSREYNVALSEARAQSVKSIMSVQGPSLKQMRTIGYGEEVPIVRGHTQNSWEQNRRVEIKYDDNR